MKKLVRGGLILTLISLFVVFIYAQANVDDVVADIANDSQLNNTNNISGNFLTDNFIAQQLPIQQDNKNTNSNNKQDESNKLVKKTAMVTAAGASKGAFSATAYCFSGRTAMGHPVRRGLIAADPRVLKLGSKVYVSAGQWSGTYLVSDTGGAIKGKKIDIWVPGCSEARKFGRRSVQISTAQ